MNYNFYAGTTDKLHLLAYLFTETDLRMYDLSSAYSQEISEYSSADEVAQNVDLNSGGSFAATFQLWSPRFGAPPEFRRVELNPRYCKGHTFRYRTIGWGLIQLYFGGLQNGELAHSHIGHFNEKGALGQEAAGFSTVNQVAAWNWTEIHRTARQLKYLVHTKWAVYKFGSRGVLPGAAELEKQGMRLT
ncbi:hypothetical protein [Hymenobacter weizhouensis]|uniref:hypothetical protein n=1 Tax=Hymenobacter sp. YIM 151500-1 TaxID=2987689 RepID=UPI0022262206|nr:hypothetical protein [Hymenobacter sp. YIM 151500-1]UYZ62711.1 hypothetical protein OIS53_17135 [Hymenobacter sp. YIM 151500-1]